MSVKAVIILCAQALLIQSAFSQCASRGNYGAGLSGYGLRLPSLAGNGDAYGSGLEYGAGIGIGSGLRYGVGIGSGLGCGSGLEYGTDIGIGAGLGYGVGQGYGGLAIGAISTSGGALPVSSASAIAPTGLSVESENVYEGALSVAGELPFLGAVALEGVFPSAGAGVVNYSCGNGVTGIESIGSSGAYSPAGVAYAPASAAYGPGIASIASGVTAIDAGLGYSSFSGYNDLAGRGCGCNIY